MTFELVPARLEHVEPLGSICFEAFQSVAERHGFPPEFRRRETATRFIEMLIRRDDFYGVVALEEGCPIGSNFLSRMDPVAGVGPITVDPGHQGKSVGRALMEDVIAYARRNGVEQVRLVQDVFNMASLSLYASLGFEARDVIAVMQPQPSPCVDGSVRLLQPEDLAAVGALSTRLYKCSRRNEVAAAARHGFLTLVRQREGRTTGYLIPGMGGHGVAETEEDALTLVGEAASRVSGRAALTLCPLSQAGFHRKLLGAGCRMIKVMTYMTLGPYEAPSPVWMPSVLY